MEVSTKRSIAFELRKLMHNAAPSALLKRCWKNLPQPLRLAALSGLCSLCATKRFSVAGGPTLFVLGAFRSSSGIAHGARIYADKKEQEGVKVVRVDVGPAMLQRADLPPPEGVLNIEQVESMTEPGTVVIHANPPQFQLVLCKLGKAFLKNKRLVAYWAWELENIPEIWKQALQYVDAVEAPSSFVRDAFAPHTYKEEC